MTLSDLFDHLHSLPPLPAVVQALLTQTSRSAHVAALVALIEQDAAICAKLLNLANSAHFRRSRDIGTASQAVLVLGHDNVRSVVISLGLMGAFSRLPVAQSRPLWRHNLCTAAVARHWAPQCGLDPDVAYTLGLVRHLGQLVMRMVIPKPMQTLDEQLPPTAPERLALEHAVLGYDSTHVSAELARRWHWPGVFEQVLPASSQPLWVDLPDPQHARLAALVHLAAWQVWAQDQSELAPDVLASWPSTLAQALGLPAQVQDVVLPSVNALCPSLNDLLA